MKLYFHPASTTSRPVALFAADHSIELEYQVIDLFAGEHTQPAFGAINPNQAVRELSRVAPGNVARGSRQRARRGQLQITEVGGLAWARGGFRHMQTRSGRHEVPRGS